jgi:DNA replication and repair protein RecF
MFCTHLSLANFRNYARLELDLPRGVSVVVGDNAQGKSNLLEALYFLATTKSFRATSDRELINWRTANTELAYARLAARIERAPAHLVDGERDKAARYAAERDALGARIAALG